MRQPRLFFVVIGFVCLIVGCSSSYNSDLLRAEHFERDGDYQAALAQYESTLIRIPADDRRQISSAHMHAGGCSLKLQRFKEAFEHYQKAVDSDPANLDAQLHLAELFVMGGLPQQALSHLELVLSKQPENPEALSLLGSVEAAAGNTKKAIELFAHSLRNDPGRENTSLALAELYNRNQNTDQARSVLMRSSVTNPKNAMAALALGRLEEQQGNTKAAESAYRSALQANDSALPNLRLAQFLQRGGRVAEAEQVLRHLDSIRPALPAALADFQLSAGQPDLALQHYLATLDSALLNASASHPRLPSPAAALAARLVEAQLQSASLSQELQRADASDSAKSKPTVTSAAHLLLEKHHQILDEATIAILESEIALAEGDIPRAEMQAMIARSRAPESAAAHYIRGVVFRRQDKVAEAKEEWNSALAIDPEHLPSRLALATQSLEESDAATAEDQVSAVVREEPGNIAALNLYARVLLAERRFPPARGILSRALAIAPNALEALVILGDIEMAQHRYSLALIAYQKALLAHPDSSGALHGLLNVYRQSAITRPVLLQMEKVANARPSSASLMEITGRLYEEHGWHTDAVRALRSAVEINANRSTATLALTNAYYAKGDAAQANATVLSSPTLGSITASAAAMIEASKAEKQGDDAAAIRNYESAIKRGEPSGAAANNLAWIYAKHEIKLDRALALALSAVERNPKDPAMLDTLGVVYLKLRNYSSATETLRRAVSISEKMKSAPKSVGGAAIPEMAHAELYQHLAAAYTGVGLALEAAAALAKAQSAISR